MSEQQLAINNQLARLESESKFEPLSRLIVRDGLLLNAQRWQQAHQYHRQRQNLHYQALNQPGIVSGLGVKAIAAPNNVPAQYRQEKRWLCIQPGMAIDDWGNPIIVPESINFRIAAFLPQSPQTLYVVISYVDPDRLELVQETEFVREMFRIEEKMSPPVAGEIELCRILLQSEVIELTNPQNVCFPQGNQIDLRDRSIATVKPQKSVKVAQVVSDRTLDLNWQYLRRSLDVLYPAMDGAAEVGQVDLGLTGSLLDCDLLWLSRQQLFSLSQDELDNLSQYLTAGSVVTIEVPSQETNIAELSAIKYKLQSALSDARSLAEFPEIPEQLETELEACEAKLNEQVEEITDEIANFLPQLTLKHKAIEQVQEITSEVASFMTDVKEISEANLGQVGRNHPLRIEPFLFATFPQIDNQLVQVFNWGGIVLIIGDLSAAWGLDEKLQLSRESIRTAQEMGINILHFAWKRHHLMKLIE